MTSAGEFAVHWRQAFVLPDAMPENSSIQGSISVTYGTRTMHLPLIASGKVLGDVTVHGVVSREGTALVPEDTLGSAALLTAQNASCLIPDELDYEIRSIEWDGSVATFAGVINDTFITSGVGVCTPVLVSSEDTAVFEPAFKLDSDALSWVATLDAEDVFGALKDTGVSQVRWCWKASVGKACKLLPFGKRRVTGMAKHYREGLFASEGLMLIPLEFAIKSLGFDVASFNQAKIKLTDYVENASWEGDTLRMDGTLKSSVLFLEANAFTAMLALDDVSVDVPCEFVPADDEHTFEWHMRLNPAEVLAGKKEGRWRLCFKVASGDAFILKPFGKRRPVGTMDVLAGHRVQRGGIEYSIVDDDKKNLQVRVRPASAMRDVARLLMGKGR